MVDADFWQGRKLDSFSQEEWERLCDGCGLCCLNKLEDEDSGEIFYTRVACRLLDIERCRCSDYDNRFAKVADCIKVTPALAAAGTGLPRSCAYRLIANGEDLPASHPLKAQVWRAKATEIELGDHSSSGSMAASEAMQSLSNWAVSEDYIHQDEMEEHIIRWIEQ